MSDTFLPALILPKWAPRVSPDLIRRLYLSDAKGLLDENLLDEVFYGLYCRCVSIREVTRAIDDGEINCPVCGTAMPFSVNANRDVLLCCPQCDWMCPSDAYHATFRGERLCGHNFLPVVEEFLRRHNMVRSSAEKLLLIDRLIHAVHSRSGAAAARNFLIGRSVQLRQFLDTLAYSDASTPGLHEAKSQ